jgi:hypothetical protein
MSRQDVCIYEDAEMRALSEALGAVAAGQSATFWLYADSEGKWCVRRAPRPAILQQAVAENRPIVRVRQHARVPYDVRASSARLSSSTFTRRSPRKPRSRPSICRSTSARTVSSGRLRALATRGTW